MANKSVRKISGGRPKARAAVRSGGSVGRKDRSNHQPSRSSKPHSAKRLAPRQGGSKQAARPRVLVVVDERHAAAVRSFETALSSEHRQNYRKAKGIFEKLVATAPLDVAERARVHLKACIERMGAKAPAPKTAWDYHVLGVAELNVRQLDRAIEHLSKAQKLEPKREEIRYALAAAYSLQGNREEALEQLKAAIVLRPQNRFQARRDADFRPLAGDPRFLSLVTSGESRVRRAC